MAIMDEMNFENAQFIVGSFLGVVTACLYACIFYTIIRHRKSHMFVSLFFQIFATLAFVNIFACLIVPFFGFAFSSTIASAFIASLPKSSFPMTLAIFTMFASLTGGMILNAWMTVNRCLVIMFATKPVHFVENHGKVVVYTSTAVITLLLTGHIFFMDFTIIPMTPNGSGFAWYPQKETFIGNQYNVQFWLITCLIFFELGLNILTITSLYRHRKMADVKRVRKEDRNLFLCTLIIFGSQLMNVVGQFMCREFPEIEVSFIFAIEGTFLETIAPAWIIVFGSTHLRKALKQNFGSANSAATKSGMSRSKHNSAIGTDKLSAAIVHIA